MASKKKITLPTKHKPGKGRPVERLAYISADEAKFLKRATDGKVERGPKGIPSFADDSASSNGVSRGGNGAYGGGGNTSGVGGGGGGGGGSSGSRGSSSGSVGSGNGSNAGGNYGGSNNSGGFGSQNVQGSSFNNASNNNGYGGNTNSGGSNSGTNTNTNTGGFGSQNVRGTSYNNASNNNGYGSTNSSGNTSNVGGPGAGGGMGSNNTRNGSSNTSVGTNSGSEAFGNVGAGVGPGLARMGDKAQAQVDQRGLTNSFNQRYGQSPAAPQNGSGPLSSANPTSGPFGAPAYGGPRAPAGAVTPAAQPTATFGQPQTPAPGKANLYNTTPVNGMSPLKVAVPTTGGVSPVVTGPGVTNAYPATPPSYGFSTPTFASQGALAAARVAAADPSGINLRTSARPDESYAAQQAAVSGAINRGAAMAGANETTVYKDPAAPAARTPQEQAYVDQMKQAYGADGYGGAYNTISPPQNIPSSAPQNIPQDPSIGGLAQAAAASKAAYNPATRYADPDAVAKALSRGPGTVTGTMEGNVDPVAQQRSLEAMTNAINDELGTSYTPEQVDMVVRGVAGEAINQSAYGQAAVANVMMNRLSLGVQDPQTYGYLGGGTIPGMMRGIDAAGVDPNRPNVKANSVYNSTVPGTTAYNTGLRALANATSPYSEFSQTASPGVLNATHYYNPDTSNPDWGAARSNNKFEAVGDHVFGNAEQTASTVADLRDNGVTRPTSVNVASENPMQTSTPTPASSASSFGDVYNPADYENTLSTTVPSWQQSTYTGTAPTQKGVHVLGGLGISPINSTQPTRSSLSGGRLDPAGRNDLYGSNSSVSPASDDGEGAQSDDGYSTNPMQGDDPGDIQMPEPPKGWRVGKTIAGAVTQGAGSAFLTGLEKYGQYKWDKMTPEQKLAQLDAWKAENDAYDRGNTDESRSGDHETFFDPRRNSHKYDYIQDEDTSSEDDNSEEDNNNIPTPVVTPDTANYLGIKYDPYTYGFGPEYLYYSNNSIA